MQNIRNLVSSILDKVDLLLTTEPARVIGYGAAVVVYLVARVLTERGYLSVQLTFDQSIGAAFGAVASLIVVVESIRRFVYSPATFVQNLNDEVAFAHEMAHAEEDLKRWKEAIDAPQNKPQTKTTVAVGTSQADGASTKAN